MLALCSSCPVEISMVVLYIPILMENKIYLFCSLTHFSFCSPDWLTIAGNPQPILCTHYVLCYGLHVSYHIIGTLWDELWCPFYRWGNGGTKWVRSVAQKGTRLISHGAGITTDNWLSWEITFSCQPEEKKYKDRWVYSVSAEGRLEQE